MNTGEMRAGFWVRCWAAIIDFVILAVILAMVVSFLSVAVGSWRVFLALRPGMPQSGIIEGFGRPFLFAVLVFFVLSSWLYFAFDGKFGDPFDGRETHAESLRCGCKREANRILAGYATVCCRATIDQRAVCGTVLFFLRIAAHRAGRGQASAARCHWWDRGAAPP